MSEPARVVRPARPGDCRRIEQIRIAGWQAAYAGLIDADALAALSVREERVAAWRDRLAPPHVTLVAETAAGIVGFASCVPARDEDVTDSAELAALYVDPRHWSAGHGSALLEAGLAALPHPHQVLWVLAGNGPARRFYARHGFRPDGTSLVSDLPGRPVEVRYRRSAGAPVEARRPAGGAAAAAGRPPRSP